MRTFVLAFVLALASGGLAVADVTGHWEGAISRFGSIQRVDVDLVRTPAGLSGTYDIPEMTLYGEPLKNVVAIGNTVSFGLLYGRFSLTLASENEMTGINTKWKPPVDLHLKRAYLGLSYTAIEKRIRNGATGLAGTLYLPDRREPVPLIVVAPGSSDAGRKEWELRGYGPALAAAGIATFVYDKRGVGASSKQTERVTFLQLASDLRAIVDTLRTSPSIDPERVGVLGLSQGGWISLMAAHKDPSIRFVVLGAGPARSVEQQEMDRVEYTLRERKAPQADIDAALAYTKTMFDVSYRGADKASLAAAFATVAASPAPAWADVISGPDPGESVDGVIADYLAQKYDPTADLRSLRIPVLAFFGTNDTLVPPATNAALLDADLANDPGHRTIVIDGANHGMFMGQEIVGTAFDWPTMFWRWDRRAPAMIPAIVAFARGG